MFAKKVFQETKGLKHNSTLMVYPFFRLTDQCLEQIPIFLMQLQNEHHEGKNDEYSSCIGLNK